MVKINAGQFRAVCMAALFTMGSAVISAPYRGSDGYAAIGFTVAFATALFCFSGLAPAVNYVYKCRSADCVYRKTIFGIIYFFTAALIFADAIFSFNVFCDFVSRNIIEKTPKPIIALIFAAVIYFASINRDGTMLKFSLFSAVISAAVIIVFFFFLVPRFNFEYLFPVGKVSTAGVFSQTVSYFFRVFLPAFPLLLYPCLCGGEKGSVITGLAVGGVITAVTMCCGILIFGAEMAADMNYAYADAISTVSIGYLFTRMDGFSYFVFFATSLVKICICVELIEKLSARLNIRRRKIVCAVLSILMLGINVLV